jgi:hypothetical protein
VRKSSRSATIVYSAEVQAKESARKAQPRKSRVVVQSRTLSQEEQLQIVIILLSFTFQCLIDLNIYILWAQAVETERENKASLAALERIEEEKKKVAPKKQG